MKTRQAKRKIRIRIINIIDLFLLNWNDCCRAEICV
jgi:hypothetical protein